MSVRMCLLAVLLVSSTACRNAEDSDPAIPNNTNITITVSGLSSGGYMAGQLHVAHSELISGVGILAAGPYRCSDGKLMQALSACVSGEGLVVDDLVASTISSADAGKLDALDNLTMDRVWIYHGSQDSVVDESVSAAAVESYRSLGIDSSAIRFVKDIPSTHGFPTLQSDIPCDVMQSPFVNGCDYDAAGEMLQFLVQSSDVLPVDATGQLSVFEQNANGAGLLPEGYIYRPAQCKDRECDLHIVLHGCAQNATLVGDAIAKTAGYNRWADALNLVVIYPQAAANAMTNPLGCWDWWGYTGPDYATKDGPQVKALHAIIMRYQQGKL